MIDFEYNMVGMDFAAVADRIHWEHLNNNGPAPVDILKEKLASGGETARLPDAILAGHTTPELAREVFDKGGDAARQELILQDVDRKRNGLPLWLDEERAAQGITEACASRWSCSQWRQGVFSKVPEAIGRIANNPEAVKIFSEKARPTYVGDLLDYINPDDWQKYKDSVYVLHRMALKHKRGDIYNYVFEQVLDKKTGRASGSDSVRISISDLIASFLVNHLSAANASRAFRSMAPIGNVTSFDTTLVGLDKVAPEDMEWYIDKLLKTNEGVARGDVGVRNLLASQLITHASGTNSKLLTEKVMDTIADTLKGIGKDQTDRLFGDDLYASFAKAVFASKSAQPRHVDAAIDVSRQWGSTGSAIMRSHVPFVTDKWLEKAGELPTGDRVYLLASAAAVPDNVVLGALKNLSPEERRSVSSSAGARALAMRHWDTPDAQRGAYSYLKGVGLSNLIEVFAHSQDNMSDDVANDMFANFPIETLPNINCNPAVLDNYVRTAISNAKDEESVFGVLRGLHERATRNKAIPAGATRQLLDHGVAAFSSDALATVANSDPGIDEETIDRLVEVHNSSKYEDEKKRAVASLSFFRPGINGGVPVAVKPKTGKLRKLRDAILATGNDRYPVANAGNMNIPGQIRVGKEISAQKIQKYLDSLPDSKYYVSFGFWDGAQRHSGDYSTVMNIAMSDDHVRKLRDAGLFDHYRKIAKEYYQGAHPAPSPAHLGWIRYTGKKKDTENDLSGGYHIDEIQSDLFGRYERKDKSPEDEEKFKKIKEIVFDGRRFGEVFLDCFMQHHRDKGEFGTPVHIWTANSKRDLVGQDDTKPPPVHMQESYDKAPAAAGFEPAKYGDIQTQNGGFKKGKPTTVERIRKSEEDLGKMALVWDADKEKAPLYVYRFEDESGAGAYSSDAMPDRLSGATARRPKPSLDFNEDDQYDSNLYNNYARTRPLFAFLKPEDAMRWFGYQNVNRLQEHNVHLRKVPASKVWLSESGRQVMFHPHETYVPGEGEIIEPKATKGMKTLEQIRNAARQDKLPVVKSEEELAKMAFKDLPQGSAITPDDVRKESSKTFNIHEYPVTPDWSKHFDYSSLLSPVLKANGYSIHVTHRDHPPNLISSGIIHARVLHKGIPVGHVSATVYRANAYDVTKKVGPSIEPHSSIEEAYRGKGLGKALYEAAIVHGMRHMGVKMVYGGSHTDAAHAIHESLARKHGTQYAAKKLPIPYRAVANDNSVVVLTHNGYKYTVKSEQPIDNELDYGTTLEMEHTTDRKEAQKIAQDHLNEDPHYYSKLKAAGLAKVAPAMSVRMPRKVQLPKFHHPITQPSGATIQGEAADAHPSRRSGKIKVTEDNKERWREVRSGMMRNPETGEPMSSLLVPKPSHQPDPQG